MKTCRKCGHTLSLDRFNKNRSRKDGLSTQCKDCNKANLKRHYSNNTDYYKSKTENRRRELHSWYSELKAELSCQECGEDHPACLHFHHRDPSKKEIALSKIWISGWGMKRIQEEIDKCDVLCANCHAKLHWSERHETTHSK